jgi:hypothetical protein
MFFLNKNRFSFFFVFLGLTTQIFIRSSVHPFVDERSLGRALRSSQRTHARPPTRRVSHLRFVFALLLRLRKFSLQFVSTIWHKEKSSSHYARALVVEVIFSQEKKKKKKNLFLLLLLPPPSGYIHCCCNVERPSFCAACSRVRRLWLAKFAGSNFGKTDIPIDWIDF